MTNPFHFKQFTIRQEQTAMKVGTDGVLLGAWARVEHAESVLDIGTGTGLLALMAAQRNAHAKITAIDIDVNAVKEAGMNVRNSPWNNRLSVFHFSLQQLAATSDKRFESILCNPPFFKDTAKRMTRSRRRARQQNSLDANALSRAVSQLLSEKGVFSMIYPVSERETLLHTFSESGLFPARICIVKPTNNKAPNRLLVEFSKQMTAEIEEEELVIEPVKRHQYSKKYQQLTSDFYL